MNTPIPYVETTPKAAITVAQTPLDLVNTILDDPEVQAVVTKYAGTPNTMPATIAGGIITAVVAHYGLHLDAAAVGTLSSVGGVLLGLAWSWFSKTFLTPATPVTQTTAAVAK